MLDLFHFAGSTQKAVNKRSGSSSQPMSPTNLTIDDPFRYDPQTFRYALVKRELRAWLRLWRRNPWNSFGLDQSQSTALGYFQESDFTSTYLDRPPSK